MASIHEETTKAGNKAFRVKWRDETNRQVSRSFPTMADARSFAADVDRGAALDPRDARRTLDDFIERDYLTSHPRWSPATRELVESHVRTHIRPALGGMRLADIRPTTLGRFVGELDDKNLAPTTVSQVYSRAIAILRAAHADRLIPEVPELPKADRPRVPRRSAQEVVVLDPLDIGRLADAVPTFLAPLVWTVAGTGLRISEALGLTTEALDLSSGELIVDRQLVTPAKGGAHLTDRLKTDASTRTLPLGARASRELAEHIDRRPPIELNDPLDGTRSLIFTNRLGKPVRRQSAGDAWSNARDRLHLPADARGWHTLRHFYAFALIRSGLSVIEVQARLGHSSADETLGTYGHLWSDSGTRTVDALDALMPDERGLRAV